MMPERARPELCVGAIALDHDHADGPRLLLIKRGREPGKGLWSVPGGRVEGGETMAEATQREFLEETGLRCEVGSLVGWVERISGTHHFAIFDFEVRVTTTDPPRAGDDADDARWFSEADLASLDMVDGLAEFLAGHKVLNRSPF